MVTWGTITWNVGNYGDIRGISDECGTLNIPYPAVTQGSKFRLTEPRSQRLYLYIYMRAHPEISESELSSGVEKLLKRNFD